VTESRIPGDAIDAGATDIAASATTLLAQLNLLPSEGDRQKAGQAGAAFGGPPDSVAIIESGATAASKWWSTAIGLSGAGLTGAIGAVWNDQIGRAHV